MNLSSFGGGSLASIIAENSTYNTTTAGSAGVVLNAAGKGAFVVNGVNINATIKVTVDGVDLFNGISVPNFVHFFGDPSASQTIPLEFKSSIRIEILTYVSGSTTLKWVIG